MQSFRFCYFHALCTDFYRAPVAVLQGARIYDLAELCVIRSVRVPVEPERDLVGVLVVHPLQARASGREAGSVLVFRAGRGQERTLVRQKDYFLVFPFHLDCFLQI